MPSNLYGVANAPNIALTVPAIGNLACNPGVETNVMDSGVMIAPSQGFYYPVIQFQGVFSFGASAPTGIVFAGRIGAGADFATWTANLAGMAGSTFEWFNTTLIGPPSSVPWISPGSHIFVTVNPTAQAITISNVGSYAAVFLIRAPDQ